MSLDWRAPSSKDAFAAWNMMHNTGDKAFPKGSPEDLEGDRQWIITESLIFRFIGVDMGSLTEKNIDELFIRNNIVSRIIGTPFRMYGKDADFTMFDLRRRIGLTTNVSTLSRSQFKKRWWTYLEREATSAAICSGDKADKEVSVEA